MGFSYNPDSPGPLDKVRLIIGDTSSSSFVFEDSEIRTFLSLQGSDIQLAAVQALRTLAVDKAKIAIYYSVNRFTLDRRVVPDRLLQAAAMLEKAAFTTPFEFETILDHFIDVRGRDLSNYSDTPA